MQSDNNLELDWKECVEWIKRCGFLISKDSKLINQTSALYLLFEMSDGILPLNILRRLSGNKIDLSKYREYTSNPRESQFQCLKNLKLFNKLAIEFFNVVETEIVEPDKLYHGREFGKFILLLSKISKSTYAKAAGILGFPSENHSISVDHQYYNLLCDLASKSDIMMRRTYNRDNNNEDGGGDPGERKVYESLVEHKYTTEPGTVINKTRRELCILEIVESEKNYVDSLQLLINGYKNPMSVHLDQMELDTIFKYIDDLYTVHVNFYKEVAFVVRPKGVSGNQSKKLHNVFIESKPNMLVYGKYCSNLKAARDKVIDIVKTNGYKRTQFERCQEFSDKFRMFPLTDLLTLPMQRVLKYHLLLESLLKATDVSDEDIAGLRVAHEAMIDLSRFVNEVKRDKETISSIDKIQSEMVQIHLPKYKKLSDYGRRLKDGELKIQSETDVKPKMRHIFIFDKMIMIAKRKNDNYDFQSAYYLQEKRPEETNIQPRRQERLYPFLVTVGQKKDELKSMILFAKSEEERNQWMCAVNTAIDNQYPPGYKDNGYLFIMCTFIKNEVCDFCGKLLRGCFYQGYHCKVTGRVSHKECIPSVSSTPLLSPRFFDCGDMSPFYCGTYNSTTIDSVTNENNNKRGTCRQLPSPPRDPFNMVPFVDISQECKGKLRQQIEPYDNEPWYVGEMEREEANNLLENSAMGTFLIRISRNHRRAGEYSLSVKDKEPRHMKIQKNISDNTFCLEEVNKFYDLRDLVSFFSKTCLNNYFDRLRIADLKLSIPLKCAIQTQIQM